MIDALADLLSRNAFLVLGTFAVSLLANLIQIGTYLRDRQRLRANAEESARLRTLVDTYAYVLDLAQRNMRTDEQLQAAEAEVVNRKSTAVEIERRIEDLRSAAQRGLVQSALDQSIRNLLATYEDVVAWRERYAALGPLPDIPPTARQEIEREVAAAVGRPHELPRALLSRAFLLILIVFLLPGPVDNIVTVIFLHVFLATFFEAAALYPDVRVSSWIWRRAHWIGFGAAFGLWYFLLNFFEILVARPFVLFRNVPDWWPYSEGAIVVVSVMAGALHWRLIGHVAEKARPPKSASGATTQPNPPMQPTGSAGG